VSEQNVEWVRSVYAAQDPLAVLAASASPDVEVDRAGALDPAGLVQ
jgi:hypothetical protein